MEPGAGARRLAQADGSGYLSRAEAALLEHLHPRGEWSWRGGRDWRVPPVLAHRSPSQALAAPPRRFSLFIKSQQAGLRPGQRPHWNSIDPETRELRMQCSVSREHGQQETALMAAALRFCQRHPQRALPLAVYDGERAGQRWYWLFAVLLKRRDGQWLVGEVVRTVERVPWVPCTRERWAAERARCAEAAAAAAPREASKPQRRR
ncbi:hypothetical protein ABPG75_004585 [Micractinium tetrahymenae]